MGELADLAAKYPFKRFASQLMLALYRSGRQAEALEVYRQTHAALDQALGIEPSTDLQKLRVAILRQEPGLEAPSAASGVTGITVSGISMSPSAVPMALRSPSLAVTQDPLEPAPRPLRPHRVMTRAFGLVAVLALVVGAATVAMMAASGRWSEPGLASDLTTAAVAAADWDAVLDR